MSIVDIESIQNDADGGQLRDAFRAINMHFGSEIVDIKTIQNTQNKYSDRVASGIQLKNAFKAINIAFGSNVIDTSTIQNVCNGHQLKNAFKAINETTTILVPINGWTGKTGCQQDSAEIAVDDENATYVNNWTYSNFSPGYYGIGYHHFNDGTNTGGSCTFPLRMNATAEYEVYAQWTAGTGRATGAIYTINHVNGSDDITVDQTLNGSQFNLLGVFTLDLLSSIVLKSSDTGSVIADAVKAVRV